jgi:hypothetical protein
VVLDGMVQPCIGDKLQCAYVITRKVVVLLDTAVVSVAA